MAVPLRPLTRVEQVLHELELEITFAYDDIVFAEHNAFLLQFGDKGEDVFLHFNVESESDKRDEIEKQLKVAGEKQELCIIRKGLYKLEQVEDENMKLTFIS